MPGRVATLATHHHPLLLRSQFWIDAASFTTTLISSSPLGKCGLPSRIASAHGWLNMSKKPHVWSVGEKQKLCELMKLGNICLKI